MSKPISILLAGIILPAMLAAQSAPAKGAKVDTEVVELTPYGFYPKQITRPPGKHFIYVRNVTTLRNLSLSLANQAGAVLKQKALANDSPHWNELWDLIPGAYTLTEASHPSWRCQIVIKPGN